MAGDINKAVSWAISIANDDTHGYDQEHRDGPDYDCSSFIGHALAQAGFNVNPSFTTGVMYKALKNVGFTSISVTSKRKLGDIFIVYNSAHHHTVMCINSTQIVHASINEFGGTTGGQTGDQTGTEICVRDFYTPSGGWTYHMRPPAGNTPTAWISNNRYLSESQKQNNAKLTYNKLSAYGWTLNAIAATLGNFERESTINPGIWQNLDSGNMRLGYGMAQWTPASKYIDWANSKGYDIKNGDYQLSFLQYETDSNHYWVQRDGYNITFAEYQKSTAEPEYLAMVFLRNYENAGIAAASERKKNARKWYEYLGGYTPDVPVDPDTPDDPDIPADDDHIIVSDEDDPENENKYEYLNNIYRKLQKETSYNLVKLTPKMVTRFKHLIVGDTVNIKKTFERRKRIYGYDAYGKHIHMTEKRYRIAGVLKDGFIILKYKGTGLPVYIEPRMII